MAVISAALQPYTPVLAPRMLQTQYLSSFSVCLAKEWERNTDITDLPEHPQKFPNFQPRASVPSKADTSHWQGFPVPAAGKYGEKLLYCHIWTIGAKPKLKIFPIYCVCPPPPPLLALLELVTGQWQKVKGKRRDLGRKSRDLGRGGRQGPRKGPADTKKRKRKMRQQ